MEITREKVKQLLFSSDDVLKDKNRKNARKHKLNRALMLGNLYKRKVKIQLLTAEGFMKKVDTTIWSVGEEFVSLKDGIYLPIKSILDIDFS